MMRIFAHPGHGVGFLPHSAAITKFSAKRQNRSSEFFGCWVSGAGIRRELIQTIAARQLGQGIWCMRMVLPRPLMPSGVEH